VVFVCFVVRVRGLVGGGGVLIVIDSRCEVFVCRALRDW